MADRGDLISEEAPAGKARDQTAAGPPPAPRRRVWPFVLGVAVAWAAFVSFQLLSARSEVLSGLATLRAAKASAPKASVLKGEGLDKYAKARRKFRSAHDRVHSAALLPLHLLPVVGRQVSSLDALTGAAARVAGVGLDSLGAIRAQLAQGVGPAQDRVAFLQRIAAIALQARHRLDSVNLGPSKALVTSLARARAEFVFQLGRLRDGLDRASTTAQGLAGILGGPRTYLVLAANNAEMRAGSGMFLMAGLMTTRDGSLTMTRMTSTEDLALPPGAVSLPEDLSQRWGWLHPNEEWRNLALSPRFDQTAELAARMWAAHSGTPVDGVIAVDVKALRAVLAAVGAVDVEGARIDSGNVEQEILHDQYVGGKGQDAQRRARQERLGVIAATTLSALNKGGWDTTKLVTEMVGVAGGRHILAWSDHQGDGGSWRAAGIDGALGPDSILVSMISRGAVKMDPYLHLAARMEFPRTRKAATSETQVVLHLSVENKVATGEPPEVEGPNPKSGVGEGVYLGILQVSFPGSAGAITVDGNPPILAAGADGPTQVVALWLSIPRGEHREATIRFRLPAGQCFVKVEPSARIPAVSWQDRGQSWTDDTSRTLILPNCSTKYRLSGGLLAEGSSPLAFSTTPM